MYNRTRNTKSHDQVSYAEKQVKLQFKVILLLLVTLFVIGVTAWGVALYFQRKANVEQFEEMAMVLAGVVQSSLEHSMLTAQPTMTQEMLVDISGEEMVHGLMLVSADGIVTASSDRSDIGKTTDYDAVSQVLQSGETLTRIETQNGRRELWVIAPVLNKVECTGCHPRRHKVLGVIKAAIDASPLDNQAKQQTLLLCIIGASTFLFVSVVLAYALRRIVLDRLSLLSQSAQRFSEGDYRVRADSSGKDEIGVLSQTFNQMAERVEQRTEELEASRQELANWNTTLEDRVQQRTSELSALNAVVTTVSQSLNLELILNDSLVEVLAVTDFEAGVIQLLDERTGQLAVKASHAKAAEYEEEMMARKPWQDIASQVVDLGRPVAADNLGDNSETATTVEEGIELSSAISVPLRSTNTVLGVLSLASSKPDMLSADTVHLLSAMGDAIGVALHNARTTQNLEEANKTREQLLEKLISAQEEERRRIARGLHDEASQSLVALAINLESIADALPRRYHDIREELGKLKERAINTVGEIRNLALELRPSALDDLGLHMAIDWYAKEYLKKSGLDVTMGVTGSRTKLPSYIETMLFRIMQEAFANIVKHAEATTVRIELHLSSSVIRVEIEDDGVGFDVEEVLGSGHRRQNLGLHGMLERTALLGGELTISSEPDKGTCLRIEVPGQEGQANSE